MAHCIYKFDLMLHMLPEAHKNRGLQSTMQVLVHFCVQGTSFYECNQYEITYRMVHNNLGISGVQIILTWFTLQTILKKDIYSVNGISRSF